MKINKKAVFAILAALVFVIILYLTFQDGAHTSALSNGVRLWLREHGIKARDKQLRSDAHYLEYFALGMALALFGRAARIKTRYVIFIGFGLGLLDECVKILLPIREFELIDLVKDWIGILAAVVVVTVCSRLRKKGTDKNGKTES